MVADLQLGVAVDLLGVRPRSPSNSPAVRSVSSLSPTPCSRYSRWFQAIQASAGSRLLGWGSGA